jgi:hypothetical protein
LSRISPNKNGDLTGYSWEYHGIFMGISWDIQPTTCDCDGIEGCNWWQNPTMMGFFNRDTFWGYADGIVGVPTINDW